MAKADGDNQKDVVEEAVKQFVDASMQCEKPDLDEFVKQYPGLESQIRRGIQELNKINNLFDSLVKADDSDFEDITEQHDLVGKKVGSFEIINIIGRGGMGVVYLAKDTKLKRFVAVKSIPAALAGDSTAKRRFKREAELLASLNHPNIAVIHEIIEEEKSGFLVLEHVEGETLTERIARGPLKLEETLSIGKQVAEAISAAHKKGVIHRDLKPTNIKVTPDSQVKVLDFGLAKTTVTEGGSSDVTETQAGHIIGTPAYMSPEQARGQPIDKRSDIWSFGCVLYEMLTGKILFEGETASDMLANILKTEPDFESLPENTPANIRVLLRRCLQKDPSQRLHDIADARIEISETQSGTVEAYNLPVETTIAPRLFRWEVIIIGLICLIAGVFIAGAIFMNLGQPNPVIPPEVLRFPIGLPEDKPLYTGAFWRTPLAISPDGTCIVYVGREETDRIKRLYVRYLNDLEVKLIPGTEGAFNPFFKPDGEWVGFFAPPALKIVSLTGGEPLTLAEKTGGTFGSWSGDGTIVYSVSGGRKGLHRISEDGGTPEVLLSTDREESWIRYPQVLPGGDEILYSRHFVGGGSCIEIFCPETGKTQEVLPNAHYARFVNSGHLIFLRDYLLMAVPFDIRKLKPVGSFVDLLDDVHGDDKGNPPHIAVSHNGTMVHTAYVSKSDVSKPEIRKYELLWIDHHGRAEPVGAPPKSSVIARLSPDERQIALRISQRGSCSIHVYDMQSGITTPLISEDGYRPVWSPDGTQIAFWSEKKRGVFRTFIGENTAPQLLAEEPFGGSWLWPHSWSSDERFLACTLQFGKGDDIWILPTDGDRKPYPFLDTQDGEYNPAFSPDGKWLAYVLRKSGDEQVYLMQFPDGGRPIQVSSDGGRGPIWSHDGKELFYIKASTKTMMAVKIEADPNSPIGTPEELFTLEGPYSTAGNLGVLYDISRDGRFLMQRRIEDGEFQLIYVQNWFEELKRLAPRESTKTQ